MTRTYFIIGIAVAVLFTLIGVYNAGYSSAENKYKKIMADAEAAQAFEQARAAREISMHKDLLNERTKTLQELKASLDAADDRADSLRSNLRAIAKDGYGGARQGEFVQVLARNFDDCRKKYRNLGFDAASLSDKLDAMMKAFASVTEPRPQQTQEAVSFPTGVYPVTPIN